MSMEALNSDAKASDWTSFDSEGTDAMLEGTDKYRHGYKYLTTLL
jgi:hypothetical protein